MSPTCRPTDLTRAPRSHQLLRITSRAVASLLTRSRMRLLWIVFASAVLLQGQAQAQAYQDDGKIRRPVRFEFVSYLPSASSLHYEQRGLKNALQKSAAPFFLAASWTYAILEKR